MSSLLISSIMPHPSISRNLHCCSLFRDINSSSLGHLLEFLSSANELRTLHVVFDSVSSKQEVAKPLGSISLPSLAYLSCEVRSAKSIDTCRLFMEKLVPFSIQHLALNCSYIKVNPTLLLGYVQASPTIEKLSVGEDFGGYAISWWIRQPELFLPPNIRELKFYGRALDHDDVLQFTNHLIAGGHHKIRLEFVYREGMKDGMYKLSEIQTAFDVPNEIEFA